MTAENLCDMYRDKCRDATRLGLSLAKVFEGPISELKPTNRNGMMRKEERGQSTS